MPTLEEIVKMKEYAEGKRSAETNNTHYDRNLKEEENMIKYTYSSKRLEKAVEDTVKEWEGKTYTVKSAWQSPLRPKERKDADAQQTVDNFRAWEDFMNQKIYVSHLIGLLTQCPNLWIDGEEVRDDCMGKFIGDILAKLADEEQKC